jgi:hypothetical protein
MLGMSKKKIRTPKKKEEKKIGTMYTHLELLMSFLILI